MYSEHISLDYSIFYLTSTSPDKDFELDKKKLSVLIISYTKNNFDEIFSYSDKTLKSKRTLKKPSNIYLFSVFIFFYIHTSSSSYRAGSTDIPDPLLPLLPIVHRPR